MGNPAAADVILNLSYTDHMCLGPENFRFSSVVKGISRPHQEHNWSSKMFHSDIFHNHIFIMYNQVQKLWWVLPVENHERDFLLEFWDSVSSHKHRCINLSLHPAFSFLQIQKITRLCGLQKIPATHLPRSYIFPWMVCESCQKAYGRKIVLSWAFFQMALIMVSRPFQKSTGKVWSRRQFVPTCSDHCYGKLNVLVWILKNAQCVHG